MHMDSPHDQQLPLRLLPPSYMQQLPPLSPLGMSELPVRYEDQSERPRQQPSRDVDVASTLAVMSRRQDGTSSTRLPRPASPAWSHSSQESDGTNDSVKSESFTYTENSSTWPSPLAMCSESSPVHGSFSSECSDKSLPRLPELDHISLESLASHYASSSTDRSRPHPVGYALQATPRSHHEGNQPLPPMMQHQQQLPQHPQHQHQQHHHHHYSSSASSAIPGYHHLDYASMKPKRKSPVRGTRCNVKYTIEQKDFVDYWRIDRHGRETPWDDVVREYNIQFKGPQRGSGGLQSAWYRENKKIPILDDDGMLKFDENDELCTTEVPVRAAKGRLQSIKAIGLLSTHPERAIEYEWVTREHKRQIWKTGHARKIQLDAAARRQRQRADAEAHHSRSHIGMLNGAELMPFHGPHPLMRPGMGMGMGMGSMCA